MKRIATWNRLARPVASGAAALHAREILRAARIGAEVAAVSVAVSAAPMSGAVSGSGPAPPPTFDVAAEPRWVLEVDVGGRTLRVATRPVEVETLAGLRAYSGGLAVGALPLEATSASVSIVDAARPWAGRGPLVGRRAELRWWPGRGRLEAAPVALRGLVTAASYGAPGAPDQLSLSLARASLSAARSWPPLGARVSAAAWPVRAGIWSLPEASIGAYYPTVLGGPGQPDGTDGAYPATPALMVEHSPADTGSRLLIADGHVAATEVRLFRVDTGESDTRPVQLVRDGRGRPVSVVDFVSSGIFPNVEGEYWIGWPPAGGTVGPTGPIAGVGDLVEWAVSALGVREWDRARQARYRSQLNGFAVGWALNEPIEWAEILAALVETYPLVEREGVDGRWIQPLRWAAPLVEARLEISAATGATRTTAWAEEADEGVANAIRVEYGSAEAGARFVRAVSIEAAEDRRCAESVRSFGEAELVVEAALVADSATAGVIARSYVARRALPGQLATWSASPDLATRLEVGDVVRVVDPPWLPAAGAGGIVREIATTDEASSIVVFLPAER
jgi:hypothetical protein